MNRHRESVSFISPNHLVAKDVQKTKFRLMIDLKKFKDAVEPDVSTFLTPSEVITQVNPSSKFFIVKLGVGLSSVEDTYFRPASIWILPGGWCI